MQAVTKRGEYYKKQSFKTLTVDNLLANFFITSKPIKFKILKNQLRGTSR